MPRNGRFSFFWTGQSLDLTTLEIDFSIQGGEDDDDCGGGLRGRRTFGHCQRLAPETALRGSFTASDLLHDGGEDDMAI